VKNFRKRIGFKLNILDEIAARTKERISEKKKTLPLEKLMNMAEQAGGKINFPFEDALRKQGMNFICEIKKASPSKGIIAEDFPYLQIAQEYEEAGAAAISVLTEPFWFMGDDTYLREIAELVTVPLLRKDFIVDVYMIYESKILGASAVLLICAILSQAQLSEYIEMADRLGLSCLVEAHDEDEVKMALDAKARVIGVNNRDLKTFTVDTGNSVRLRALVPKETIFVSESGIRNFEDVELLRANGVNAVLIGETLMRTLDKKAAMAGLRFKP
jgi:indole-3-glycerol phosphate synthase